MSDTLSQRLSMDTTANINGDVTWGLDASGPLLAAPPGSVLSSFRPLIDGNSTIAGFNILKHGVGADDERDAAEFSPLGPNSIFELTVASDTARTRLNRPLKSLVTINGGTTTVYNLTRPLGKEIPQIQLQKLHRKVSLAAVATQLVDPVKNAYAQFESTFRLLTEEAVRDFEQLKILDDKKDATSSDPEINAQADDIPLVFENADFRLDDPRVFRNVLGDFPGLDSVADKLSGYLDLAEVKLTQEIARTLGSFFSTLSDLQSVQRQLEQCLKKVHNLNGNLSQLEQHQIGRANRVLDLLDERANVSHLETTVHQLQATLVLLANAKRLAHENPKSCLDEVLICDSLIRGVEPHDLVDPDVFPRYPRFQHPMVNLSKLPALTHVLRDLSQLRSDCSAGFVDEFGRCLLGDLREHGAAVSEQETLRRLYVQFDRQKTHSSYLPNRQYLSIDDDLKATLADLVRSLIKLGQLARAYSDYQERIVAEVKQIIRENLPLTGTDLMDHSNSESRASLYNGEPAPGEQGASLSASIRRLSNSEFAAMISKTYTSLSECLRRLTVHQKLLLDLSLSNLPQESLIDVMTLDITAAISKAVSVSQVRLVKVLNVRSEQLGNLPLSDYLHIYAITAGYAQECEYVIPGDAAGPFTEWVRSHVGYYMHRFHSNSVRALAAETDKETWRELTDGDLLAGAQGLTNLLLSYAQFVETGQGNDGSSWVLPLDYFPDSESQEPEEDRADHSISRLSISELKFLVPSLIPKALKTVADYVALSKIFPTLGATVKSNLLTYFKVMNSRISQAVLNAGATRTAGLKHITTKHIALCIQTVEFLEAFMGGILPIFEKIPMSDPLADESFNLIATTFSEHEKELFNKLISIMQERTLLHCAAIKKLDLSVPISHPQQCHPYMEVLVKETLTVSRTLGKYLRDEENTYILLQIFENYKRLLVHCFCTELPQLKDFNEKHSLLKDIDYFRVRLGETPGYANSGQVIWENVNSLPTEEESKMNEVMRKNIEGERLQNERLAAESARASLEVRNSVEEKQAGDAATEKKEADRKKDAEGEEDSGKTADEPSRGKSVKLKSPSPRASNEESVTVDDSTKEPETLNQEEAISGLAEESAKDEAVNDNADHINVANGDNIVIEEEKKVEAVSLSQGAENGIEDEQKGNPDVEIQKDDHHAVDS